MMRRRSSQHPIVIRDGEADTADVAAFESDRRELMRRGLVAGGVFISAASIPMLMNVRNAFAQANSDGEILVKAIGLEQTAVFAYDTAVKSGLLEGPQLEVAQLFGRHEQEHADALITALKSAGGRVPAKPTSPDQVKGLGTVQSAEDIVRFAIELETSAVAAYYDAHSKLADAALLQAGAQIMANEGQHLVVLRQALGQAPVPNAFATGAS